MNMSIMLISVKGLGHNCTRAIAHTNLINEEEEKRSIASVCIQTVFSIRSILIYLCSVMYVSYNIILNLTIIYKELINMLQAWAKGLKYDVS